MSRSLNRERKEGLLMNSFLHVTGMALSVFLLLVMIVIVAGNALHTTWGSITFTLSAIAEILPAWKLGVYLLKEPT